MVGIIATRPLVRPRATAVPRLTPIELSEGTEVKRFPIGRSHPRFHYRL